MPVQPWKIKALDEKLKTGLVEQLNTIWELSYCKLKDVDEVEQAHKAIRNSWTLYYVQQIYDCNVTPMGAYYESDNETIERSLGLRGNKGYEDFCDEAFGELLKYLAPESGLNSDFTWNLARMNFRTSKGGRERKYVEENGADDYRRPFTECKFGDWSTKLSKFIQQFVYRSEAKTKIDNGNVAAFAKIEQLKFGHCQPITVTIEKCETNIEIDPLINPKLQEKRMVSDAGSPVPKLLFKRLGSFGFNEPSYTSWKIENAETYGFRFNLGARSSDKHYLNHFYSLLKIAENQALDCDVDKEAIQARLTLLEGNKMAEVLAYYHAKMLKHAVDKILTRCADDKVKAWLNKKLARRLEKLEGLKCALLKQVNPMTITGLNDGVVTSDIFFERVGAIESTLWEYAMLAASRTTLANINAVLESGVNVVGQSENYVSDKIAIDGENVHRHYFSSCFNSGNLIFEKLEEMAYLSIRNNEQLADYKCYFEFDFFVNALEIADPDGYHIWLNMPERFKYTTKGTMAATAEDVANDICAQLSLKQPEKDKLGVILIDYTKWISNQPSAVELNLLKCLADKLRTKTQTNQVIFFTSSLKYGSGCLERYQRGEVLSFGSDVLSFDALHEMAKTSYTKDLSDGALKRWDMGGHYLPLSHRLKAITEYVRNEVYRVALRMKS